MIELCRYMSFQRFCEILFNQELVLVKPEMWNDKYEKYIFQAINHGEGKNKISRFLKEKYTLTEDEADKIIKALIDLGNTAHCLCFSKCIDAEVMWNAYNYNSQAIMMITTDDQIEKLNFSDSTYFELHTVEYDLEDTGLDYLLELFTTYDNRVALVDAHNFFTHKRKCFKYEQEFRIIDMDPQHAETNFLPYHIDDLNTFIKGIMVHPLASDSYVSLIKKMCNSFNVKFLGKSKIYDFNDIF